MNPPDTWVKVGQSLVSTRSICGLKWTNKCLYVLFPGQQYMQLYGDEAEKFWAAVCGLAINLDAGETIPRPEELASSQGGR